MPAGGPPRASLGEAPHAPFISDSGAFRFKPNALFWQFFPSRRMSGQGPDASTGPVSPPVREARGTQTSPEKETAHEPYRLNGGVAKEPRFITKQRTEIYERILVDREVISVSYMRNLCRQLRLMRTNYGGDDNLKPIIPTAVGARGSGKTAFSRSFYHPFLRSKGKANILSGSALIKEAKKEPKTGRDGEYDEEFCILMYIIFSGRMLWKKVHGGEDEDWSTLVDQANEMSDVRIEVAAGASFKETVSAIQRQFRSTTHVLKKMRRFPILDVETTSEFLGLDGARGARPLEQLMHRLLSPRAGRAAGGRRTSIVTDAAAVELLESKGYKFTNLPLLVFLDELEVRSAYSGMSELLYESRAVLFSGAGVVEEYMNKEMERSCMRFVPYRLSPILCPRDIRDLLHTAPELSKTKLSPKEETEAVFYLLKSGGNPRLMVGAIKYFAANGAWPNDIRMVATDGGVYASERISLAAVSGLPILIEAYIEVTPDIIPLRKLEFDTEYSYMLSPSFTHPLQNAEPFMKLTRYHQIIAPVNEGSTNFLAQKYREIAKICSDPAKTKKDLGLPFEEICVQVWQTRAMLRSALVKEPRRITEAIIEQRKKIEQALAEGADAHTVFKMMSHIREEPMPAPAQSTKTPTSIFGPIGLCSLVAGAGGHDDAWESFLGSSELFVDPVAVPVRLASLWAGATFIAQASRPISDAHAKATPRAGAATKPLQLESSSPLPKQIKRGDLPLKVFFFNAPRAPGPDAGLQVDVSTLMGKKRILMAFDIKMSPRQGTRHAEVVYAEQAVKALACDPQPTHIVSVRAQESGASLFGHFKRYLDRREQLMRAFCDETNRKCDELPFPVPLLEFNPDWLHVPHIVIGRESLGHLFGTLLSELMKGKE
eukprot:gnl/Chilomastix_cuspidata/843.p1 GENE.gnl/Chilomastix_cuspidata/843~~gnl/Chilomastix_cuspidata/843.p1  ORF type:complete len:885 (+),score=191.39 gnl/Chilomastix_cuspidata/843:993-3647(+)